MGFFRSKVSQSKKPPLMNEHLQTLLKLNPLRPPINASKLPKPLFDRSLDTIPIGLLKPGNNFSAYNLTLPAFPFHLTLARVEPCTDGKYVAATPLDTYMALIKRVSPMHVPYYVQAYSNVAQQYFFNAFLINVANRPVTNAFRFAVYVNYHLLVATIRFSLPGFENDHAEELASIKDRLARSVLCQHFDLCKNTVSSYLKSFKSLEDVPKFPDKWDFDPEVRGLAPGKRRWYTRECEDFLAIRINEAIDAHKAIPPFMLSLAFPRIYMAALAHSESSVDIRLRLDEIFPTYKDIFLYSTVSEQTSEQAHFFRDEWFFTAEAHLPEEDDVEGEDDVAQAIAENELLDTNSGNGNVPTRRKPSADHRWRKSFMKRHGFSIVRTSSGVKKPFIEIEKDLLIALIKWLRMINTGDYPLEYILNIDETAVNEAYAVVGRVGRTGERLEAIAVKGERVRTTFAPIVSMAGRIGMGFVIIHGANETRVQPLDFTNIPYPTTTILPLHAPRLEASTSDIPCRPAPPNDHITWLLAHMSKIQANFPELVPKSYADITETDADGYRKFFILDKDLVRQIQLSPPPPATVASSASADVSSSSSTSSSSSGAREEGATMEAALTSAPTSQRKKTSKKAKSVHITVKSSPLAPPLLPSNSPPISSPSAQTVLGAEVPRYQTRSMGTKHNPKCDNTIANVSTKAGFAATLDADFSEYEPMSDVSDSEPLPHTNKKNNRSLQKSDFLDSVDVQRNETVSTRELSAGGSCIVDPAYFPHPNMCSAGCAHSEANTRILKEDLSDKTVEELRVLLSGERATFIELYGAELSKLFRENTGKHAIVNEFLLARNTKAWMKGRLMSSVVKDAISPMLKANPHANIRGLPPGKRALLLLDNCSVHKDFRFVNECLANNIDIIYLAPNTTHHMQPLDVSFNGPLKHYYYALVHALEFNRDTAPPAEETEKDKFYTYLKNVAKIRAATARVTCNTISKGFLYPIFKGHVPPALRRKFASDIYDAIVKGTY